MEGRRLSGWLLTDINLSVVLCEYLNFQIESNIYVSIRFETSTIIRNFQILAVTDVLLI